MYAVTRTGTTVNSLNTDVTSVTSGSNLGIIMLPLINLKIVIPAVTTRNTTASATDNADVYLNESASMKYRTIIISSTVSVDQLTDRVKLYGRILG